VKRIVPGLLLGGRAGPGPVAAEFSGPVPFGMFGTIWGLLKLRDNGVRIPASNRTRCGNALFAHRQDLALTGIVY